MTKYNSCRVYGFDSKKELRRFIELQALEKSGMITGLRRQVKFELIPAQKDDKGRSIERACNYIADFVYNQDGIMVVEDVKSKATMTPAYIIKRKLMLYIHGIRIQEK